MHRSQSTREVDSEAIEWSVIEWICVLLIIYEFMILYMSHQKLIIFCEGPRYLYLLTLARAAGEGLLNHIKAAILAMPNTRNAKAYVTPLLIQA
jgi:hypothetical protein